MKKVLALVLSLVMLLGVCGTAFAYHTTDEVTELEIQNSDTSMYLATQGYALLENNGVLPLKGETKIALYGNAIAYTVKGGTGSGAVNNRLNAYGVNGDNIADAFVDAGWTVTNPEYVDAVRLNRGARRTSVVAAQNITDAQLEEGQAADTAIYAIARNAGEGSDRSKNNNTNGYNLSNTELNNIRKLEAAYENVIIVYNTCVCDAAWIAGEDNIDAVVYMNNGGQRGSEALVKCLTGEVNFSGKLTDTWAMSIDDYPSTEGFANLDGNTATEWYPEGIYVGYRYFDTFGLDVVYPFGFGLSYTDFEIAVLGVEADADEVKVDVAVTNVGKEYSGKEVVQVYFSAPDGELEKPYQELAAYGKTDEIAPGKTQFMTLTFDTIDMSSYSVDEAGYIMEAGNYIIRVGNSSRNTHVAAVLTLDETVVTEKLINQFPLEDNAELEEISKAGTTPITYAGEAEEIANAPRIALEGIETIDNSHYNDAETITTYLFAEDAESYVPRDEITLTTREVAGIFNNRPQPQEGDDTNVLAAKGNARYVRINCSNPATSYGFSFFELEVYSGGQNVAKGKTATAKTEGTYNNPPYSAANGVDGNTGTRWGSNWNAGDTVESWFMVDLGAEYPIDGVHILWEAAYARTVQVEFSVDGESFTTAATGSVPGNGMEVSGGGSAIRGYSTTTYGEVVEIVDPLPEGITKETAKLTDVYNGTITLKQFVACLTAQELARLCVGGAGNVQPNPDGTMIGASASSVRGGAGQTTRELFQTRHIPAMPNADGPAGIRITQNYQNREYQFCTAFPAGTCMAMTWDRDAIYAEGVAVGSEMKDYGVTTWLAPGMNIHRNPLCGRNFEYYSEDPLVSGITAASVTLGVQSWSGIGVTLKHFWGNSQETNRNAENNIIGERAAREIYLKGFEIAVKLAQPQCVMNSYNVNQGWPASDDWNTNEDLLRSEWGFKGYVMTDWGGGQSTAYIAKHGGCDMVMPGGNASVILNGYTISDPTFNADGSIRNRGNFVPKAGGTVEYVTPSNVESEEFLPEVVATAVANEEARYDKYGDDATITWYGEMNTVNKICLGDLQKSAMRILRVDLLSQDMEKLLESIDVDYTAGSYSANSDAEALAEDYAPVVKSDIVDRGIVADTITIDTVADKTAAVEVSYNGDEPITTARLTLVSELPIKDIESDYDFEYNPETDEIVVYDGAGEEISGVLFTINYEFEAVVPDGEYPIDLGVIEVTDLEGAVIFAAAIDGAIIVDNNYPIGDVTQDGEVDNRDLIMIARYLVNLVQFNEKQKIAADFTQDGIINNTDLVLIARAIVAMNSGN
jgi:hypothetical protein